MTVKSIKTNEDKRVELEIEVDAQTFGKAVDEAFKKNSKRIQVPGFRKGKAPRKMIEKLYGEGVFYEDAVNSTYPEAYEQAAEENSIDPVDRAEIEVLDVSKDGYSFKVTVAVKPEITLAQYKALEGRKKIHTVTDDEVDTELTRRREQAGRIVTVEDRAAENGDTAEIDFEGFIDGVAFEGGKGEKYPLILGSNSFIPGFEDQVVGKNSGEEFDVTVKFPDDYHSAELCGKEAVFKCKMHILKTRELPELDDELAKDISEFDTLDELKADIRKKLQETSDEHSKTIMENKLMDEVCDTMQADIPECMFKNRIDEMVREFAYNLSSQNLKLEDYLSYADIDIEGFRDTFKERAEQQVRMRLALEKIVILEKIAPSDEELEAEYEKLAKNYNISVEKVKPLVSEKDLCMNISMNKALDLVRDTAVVIEEAEEVSVAES